MEISRNNLNHDQSCLDYKNTSIASGTHYIPGVDPCILCLCESGKNLYCQAVRCAASEECLFYTTGKSCCEFICMDRVVEVLCGFCLLSILLIGLFIFYLHKRNRKVSAGMMSKSNGADLALVEHSSSAAFEKKMFKI